MLTKFTEGHIVVLTPQSPKMIINRVILKRNIAGDMPGFAEESWSEYECIWFEGSQLRTAIFKEEELYLFE